MFIHGLWWIEQWHEWHAPYYQYADDSPEGRVASPIYAIMTGVAPAVGISLGTYGGIQAITMGLEDYSSRRAYDKATLHFSTTFPFARRQFVHSAGKRAALKFGARVGARFMPGLGWALFAVDMWHVGKWIGHKTKHLVEKPPGSTPGLIGS